MFKNATGGKKKCALHVQVSKATDSHLSKLTELIKYVCSLAHLNQSNLIIGFKSFMCACAQ